MRIFNFQPWLAASVFAVSAVAVWAQSQPAAPTIPSATTRIPPPAPGCTAIACKPDEPGARLLIIGRVVDEAGRGIEGAAVIVYNTDAAGLYNPRSSQTRAPRIQCTVHTDANGVFQVLTVRPASYPNSNDPAHIHVAAVAAGYHLGDSTIWFDGDPFITPKMLAETRERERQFPREATTVERVDEKQFGVACVRHTVKLVPN